MASWPEIWRHRRFFFCFKWWLSAQVAPLPHTPDARDVEDGLQTWEDRGPLLDISSPIGVHRMEFPLFASGIKTQATGISIRTTSCTSLISGLMQLALMHGMFLGRTSTIFQSQVSTSVLMLGTNFELLDRFEILLSVLIQGANSLWSRGANSRSSLLEC